MKFKSITKPLENQQDLLKKLNDKFPLGEDHKKFLLEFNVAKPEKNASFFCEGEEFSMDFILGFSESEDEDIIRKTDAYEGRIPADSIIIADPGGGNYICTNKKHHILYWNHEINDLYFKPKSDSYEKRNDKLKFIASSFSEFLSLITETTEENGPTEYDPYNDASVPFKDSSLDFYYKRPDLFFKKNESIVSIRLKKLLLSKKGLDLLSFFREKGLYDK